jgi:GNAT superfamily N-acetyltransferase
MPNNIRSIIPQDIPYLYDISIKTANYGEDGTSLFNYPLSVGQFFSAPFFQFEPALCSIALDYNNRPSGYIVGTSNTVLFNSWLNTKWLPPLQAFYSLAQAKSEEEKRVISKILKGKGQGLWEHSGYPAHLRVDLLPSIRKQGIGRSLIETYLTKLYKKEIPGVHVRIPSNSESNIGFYEKMGFVLLEDTDRGYFMGKKLN